jgi:fructose-1,6-bisphosphatase/inositol monophosphatase family enzyme
MTLRPELDFAIRAAVAAGHNAVRIRRSGIAPEAKPDETPVTAADRDNERLLCEMIESAYPADGILGEEGARKPSSSGRRWTIDPIDGTRDFVRDNRVWCVLIALEIDGEPQLGVAHFPKLDETYWAVRGHGAWLGSERLRVSSIDRTSAAVISPNGMHAMAAEPYAPGLLPFLNRFWAVRSFGGALDACLLAAGKIDVWFERKAEIWDLAPLQVILEEAGAAYFALDGSRRCDAGNAFASTPVLQREVRDYFAIPSA